MNLVETKLKWTSSACLNALLPAASNIRYAELKWSLRSRRGSSYLKVMVRNAEGSALRISTDGRMDGSIARRALRGAGGVGIRGDRRRGPEAERGAVGSALAEVATAGVSFSFLTWSA